MLHSIRTLTRRWTIPYVTPGLSSTQCCIIVLVKDAKFNSQRQGIAQHRPAHAIRPPHWLEPVDPDSTTDSSSAGPRTPDILLYDDAVAVITCRHVEGTR